MKILLIIGDQEKRARLYRTLRGRGLEVEEASNGRQGFSRALSGRFTIVVVDPTTEGWDRDDGVRSLAHTRPLLRIVLAAPAADQVTALEEEFKDVEQILRVLPIDDLARGRFAAESFKEAALALRRAKIVATVGPACSEKEMLRALIEAGVDVCRLNFSHGDHAWHAATLKKIREASAEIGRPVAVLGDLCGPKIRTGRLAGSQIQLVRNDAVTLCAEDVLGTSERFSISLPQILGDLVAGDRVLLDDGNLELVVEAAGQQAVRCRVVHGGLLKERKGINLPGALLRLPGLTEKDREDLEFGIRAGVDYIAVSFVREAAHVTEPKRIIQEHGADIHVIAKIEKPEAVASIEEVMAACDGVMVARGDLGVELAATRVPHLQRKIIRLARHLGKPVITATQMLESMTEKPRPTRAEVADVSKAVEDGSDAVMLSAETASGRYPVQAVETMAAVIAETEAWVREAPNPFLGTFEGRGLLAALSQGLAIIADNVDLSLIAVATRSGRTVLAFSKTQPDAPLLALSDTDVALRRVCLYHGVHPARAADLSAEDAIVRAAEESALAQGLARHGEMMAVVWDPEWKGGGTGSLAIRFHRIRG